MSSHQQRALAPSFQTDSVDTAVIEKSLVIQLNESEFSQQIQIARTFPRAVDRTRKAIIAMATMDEESAGEMIYSKPQGGEKVEGPSIRFAEALAQVWGNCRHLARVIDVNRAEKYVEAEGIFIDLETNMATVARHRRRIFDKHGKLYSDDMITTTGNAAASIARRNAILGGIPKAIYRTAYDRAREMAGGTVQDLPKKRTELVAAFARIGVLPDKLYRKIGVAKEDQIGLDHIVTLRGMWSALRSGEATQAEIFSFEEALPTHDAARKTKPRTLAEVGEQFNQDPIPDRVPPRLDDQDTPAGEVSPDHTPAGTAPSETDEAYAHGAQACRAGATVKSCPPKYKASKTVHQAWKDGFAAAAKESGDGDE